MKIISSVALTACLAGRAAGAPLSGKPYATHVHVTEHAPPADEADTIATFWKCDYTYHSPLGLPEKDSKFRWYEGNPPSLIEDEALPTPILMGMVGATFKAPLSCEVIPGSEAAGAGAPTRSDEDTVVLNAEEKVLDEPEPEVELDVAGKAWIFDDFRPCQCDGEHHFISRRVVCAGPNGDTYPDSHCSDRPARWKVCDGECKPAPAAQEPAPEPEKDRSRWLALVAKYGRISSGEGDSAAEEESAGEPLKDRSRWLALVAKYGDQNAEEAAVLEVEQMIEDEGVEAVKDRSRWLALVAKYGGKKAADEAERELVIIDEAEVAEGIKDGLTLEEREAFTASLFAKYSRQDFTEALYASYDEPEKEAFVKGYNEEVKENAYWQGLVAKYGKGPKSTIEAGQSPSEAEAAVEEKPLPESVVAGLTDEERQAFTEGFFAARRKEAFTGQLFANSGIEYIENPEEAVIEEESQQGLNDDERDAFTKALFNKHKRNTFQENLFAKYSTKEEEAGEAQEAFIKGFEAEMEAEPVQEKDRSRWLALVAKYGANKAEEMVAEEEMEEAEEQAAGMDEHEKEAFEDGFEAARRAEFTAALFDKHGSKHPVEVPTEAAPVDESFVGETYWVAPAFDSCGECGTKNHFKMRPVSCVQETAAGHALEVDNGKCDEATRPARVKVCATADCAAAEHTVSGYEWQVEHAPECPASCEEEAFLVDVVCVNLADNQQVGHDNCTGNKPSRIVDCSKMFGC